VARLLTAVVPTAEELATHLAAGDTVLRLRAADVLDCRILSASAGLGGEERTGRAVGLLVAVVRSLRVATGRVGAGAREHTVDLGTARDRRVDDGVAAVADELVVRGLQTAAAGALVVWLGASVDAAAKKLAAHQRALVEVVIVNVEVERTAALALGLVGQWAADAATLVAAAVSESLAHALAEELGLAGLLSLSNLVTVEEERVLAAAAGAVHLLVARRALAAVALEWTCVPTGAGLGARLSACRDWRLAVGSWIAGEQLEGSRTARAGRDDAW
jgi:hypothetical protein